MQVLHAFRYVYIIYLYMPKRTGSRWMAVTAFDFPMHFLMVLEAFTSEGPRSAPRKMHAYVGCCKSPSLVSESARIWIWWFAKVSWGYQVCQHCLSLAIHTEASSVRNRLIVGLECGFGPSSHGAPPSLPVKNDATWDRNGSGPKKAQWLWTQTNCLSLDEPWSLATLVAPFVWSEVTSVSFNIWWVSYAVCVYIFVQLRTNYPTISRDIGDYIRDCFISSQLVGSNYPWMYTHVSMYPCNR